MLVMSAFRMLLLETNSAPCRPDARATHNSPPTLIVQLVDPVWEPVPGANAKVTKQKSKKSSSTARTDEDGNAQFWLELGAGYSIEVRHYGFNTKRLEGINIPANSDPPHAAHVQFRLVLSGPFVTVY